LLRERTSRASAVGTLKKVGRKFTANQLYLVEQAECADWRGFAGRIVITGQQVVPD